jgi:hypothetical protein
VQVLVENLNVELQQSLICYFMFYKLITSVHAAYYLKIYHSTKTSETILNSGHVSPTSEVHIAATSMLLVVQD